MFSTRWLVDALVVVVFANADVAPDGACVDLRDDCFGNRRYCQAEEGVFELCPGTCDTINCPAGCRDEVSDCPQNRASCGTKTKEGLAMAKECRMTCKQCNQNSKVFTCRDFQGSCRKVLKNPALCTLDEGTRRTCPASCKVNGCEDGCIDQFDDCSARRTSCFDLTVSGAVTRDECPVTCGSCNLARRTVTTSQECAWDGNCLYGDGKMYCQNRKCVPFENLTKCTEEQKDQLCDISGLDICSKAEGDWRCHMSLDP